MMMAGILDCVSCLDSAAVEIVRKRSVQNAQTCRSCWAWRRRSCGSILVIGRAMRRFLITRLGVHFRIELGKALLISRQRVHSHRAVDENGQDRNPLLFLEPLQPVQQFFDAADRKRGDDDPATARHGAGDGFGQLGAVVVLLVHAVAVRRFHQQIIRVGDSRRVRQHRPAEPAQIAAEENRSIRGPDTGVCRSQQVSGIHKLHLEARHDRHRPVVANRLQLRDGAKRVGLRIQRQRRCVLRVAVAVRVRRILFLNPTRIRQDDAAEIECAGGAEHAASKSLRDQSRQVAAMIQVRVREHDCVDVGSAHRKRLPVALAQLLQALKESRVDEHFRGAGIEKVLRARDGTCGAEKLN